MDFCNIKACFIEVDKPSRQQRDSASIVRVTILCRLVMEMTADYLCHILLVTSMSLDYIAGEKIIQEHKYWGVEIIVVERLRICLLQQLCTYYLIM